MSNSYGSGISTENALRLYAAASDARTSPVRQIALGVWTVVGLAALIWLAAAEPFSAWLLDLAKAAGAPDWSISFVMLPIVMALRAVVMIEAAGYAYHRFAQHVGLLTRRFAVVRRNQRYHWKHHMVIYPFGGEYKRNRDYIPAEESSASWIAPLLVAAVVIVLLMGFTLQTLYFVAAMTLYAKYVIDVTHSRFHVEKHSWSESRYFQWLADIHVLHHWDQRYNYTIVHPLMDILFGTYLAPKMHRREIAQCMEPEPITVSDLRNWTTLLSEARPEEYAAIVSDARSHLPSRKKVERFVEVLEIQSREIPSDQKAGQLLERARRFQQIMLTVDPA